MNNPKVSVIVPVYNTEKYLHKCVDSILAQTFKDFELLLIDDGSKDTSGAICDEYASKDARVRVFHKPNGGVSSARNMGLDNAKGQYITFVDADDWVEPDILAYMMSCVYNAPHTTVFCGVQSLSGRKGLGTNYRADTHFLSIEEYLMHHKVRYSPWGILLERSHIEKMHLRFDPTLIIAEDRIFNMQYFSVYEHNIHCISRNLYVYNDINPDSACHSVNINKCISYLNSCIKMENLAANEEMTNYIQQVCKSNLKGFLNELVLYPVPPPYSLNEFLTKQKDVFQNLFIEAYAGLRKPGIELTFARYFLMPYTIYRILRHKVKLLFNKLLSK